MSGDGIVQHVKGYHISTELFNCKVYVRDFAGVKVQCMQNYVEPSLFKNSDHIVFYVGTNDLASRNSAEESANSIVK